MTAPKNNGSGSVAPSVITEPEENLEDLTPSLPYRRLTVPAVTIMLAKGRTQSQIGRQFGVSPQAVHDFIKQHKDELHDLKDFDDQITTKIRGVVCRVVDHLETRDFKRDRLGDISNLMGIGIDKIRLIEGKSTANVSSILHISASVEEHIRKQCVPQDVVVDSDKTLHNNNDKDNS